MINQAAKKTGFRGNSLRENGSQFCIDIHYCQVEIDSSHFTGFISLQVLFIGIARYQHICLTGEYSYINTRFIKWGSIAWFVDNT